VATNRLPGANPRSHDNSSINLEFGVRIQAVCGNTLTLVDKTMPIFATFEDLRRFNRDLDRSGMLKEAYASKTGKTIFLGHSSKDPESLPAVISILNNHGGQVYLDKEDERLPNSPTRKTAEILRDTIDECKRFVLFLTTNSKDRK